MEHIIANQENFEKIKQVMREEGTEKFHVLADFDRTLTKAFVEGQKSPTVIAQIRNGKYLTPDYAPRAHAFYDHYASMETDPALSREEKMQKMHEWWKKHFDLLIECGLNKQVIQEIVATRTLQFRDGTLEFLDFLHEHQIPLVIMSAAPGDMILEYLRQEGRLYDNIHIISNLFVFDEKGKVTAIKEPIIHSLNKYEIVVKNFPIFDSIKDRKNVLLLGDGLDDVGMIEGFDYDHLLKVGFLNENVDERLELYKETFDVVLTGDPGMEFVNNLVKEIGE